MSAFSPENDLPDSSDKSTHAGKATDPQDLTASRAAQHTQILIPLDGSVLAELVLPHACALARATCASLALLRIVPMEKIFGPVLGELPTVDTVDTMWETALMDARDYVGQVGALLRKEGLDAQGRVVEDGEAAAEIVGYAERHPAVTMIAMSTHGRSGLGRWVFGSVAEKVLHGSPVPLLLVRPGHREAGKGKELPQLTPIPKYRTILVPLDGSHLGEQALAQAQKLAFATGATILLLSVAPTQYESMEADTAASPKSADMAEPGEREAGHLALYLEETAGALRAAGTRVETRVACGDPAAEILAFSERAGVDLVAMATHGRSGLQRLWLGSVALRVAQHTRVPVLLVRAKESKEPHQP